MEKGAACLSAFLGVAYSGNFYTPSTAKNAFGTGEKILDTLEPACLIVSESCGEALLRTLSGRICSISYEEARKPEACEEILALEPPIESDRDELYVLFTSSSRGVPKGVIMRHRSVIDYIEWVADTFQISGGGSVCQPSSFLF